MGGEIPYTESGVEGSTNDQGSVGIGGERGDHFTVTNERTAEPPIGVPHFDWEEGDTHTHTHTHTHIHKLIVVLLPIAYWLRHNRP